MSSQSSNPDTFAGLGSGPGDLGHIRVTPGDSILAVIHPLSEGTSLDETYFGFDMTITVPGPATLALLAFGGLVLMRRKRK